MDSVEQIGRVVKARSRRVELMGLLWSLTAVAGATLCFWCLRNYLDKGQASLLYLPVVIACAVRFGFSSAVVAAFASFPAGTSSSSARFYIRRRRCPKLAIPHRIFDRRDRHVTVGVESKRAGGRGAVA